MWSVPKPISRRTTTKTRLNNATGNWNPPRKFAEGEKYSLWNSLDCRSGRKAIQQLKRLESPVRYSPWKTMSSQQNLCDMLIQIKTYVLTLDCSVMLEQPGLILNELAQVLEAMWMLCCAAVFILQGQVELSASMGGFLLMSLLAICLSKESTSLTATSNISAAFKSHGARCHNNVRLKQMLLRLYCQFPIW